MKITMGTTLQELVDEGFDLDVYKHDLNEEDSIEIIKAMEESGFHKPEECTVGLGNTEYGEFTYHAINPANKPIQVTLFIKPQQQEGE